MKEDKKKQRLLENFMYFFNKSLLQLLPICLIIFCRCEGEHIESERGGNPLRIEAEIADTRSKGFTRVSGTTWEKNDAIGVYMVKSGQSPEKAVIRKNIKYVTTGSSSFKPSKEKDEISLPFDGSKVDFISYYPYQEGIENFTYTIDLRNQSVQSAIDLLFSNNAKEYHTKNPNAKMQFSHQLSKIVLNMSSEKSLKLDNLSVILSNMGVRANFDLAKGILSTPLERDDIQLYVSKDGSIVEAILLPEKISPDMVLWFIIEHEGSEETYKIPLNEVLTVQSLQKSTLYTGNISLFGEKTVVVTESNITAWINGPTFDKTVNQSNETAPIIKGSHKAPFSVAEAQINQDRTGVWIKGYIVGSFDKSINKFIPDTEGAIASNIALAEQPDETDTNKMIPVQLPSSGSIKTALNLKDNPENLKKEVMIKGNLTDYFSAPGLRECKDYKFL